MRSQYESYCQYFKRRLSWKTFKLIFPKREEEFRKRVGNLIKAHNQIRIKEVKIQTQQAEIRRLKRELRKGKINKI